MTEQAAGWIGNAFADGVELSRLRALEGVWDENTCSILGERVMVQRGWRCLELGAGAGSIARWLADRVGPSGSVVAADLNCRFLVDMPSNVEVRALDAADAEFGREAYDLIHHRSVLSYVSSREQVLGRLVESLRPGGWLLMSVSPRGHSQWRWPVDRPSRSKPVTQWRNHPRADNEVQSRRRRACAGVIST